MPGLGGPPGQKVKQNEAHILSTLVNVYSELKQRFVVINFVCGNILIMYACVFLRVILPLLKVVCLVQGVCQAPKVSEVSLEQ